MNSFRILVLSGLLAASALLGTPRAHASNLGLFIATEDADPQSVPRDSQIMRRVLAALTEIMHTRGFDIYDETAACMTITEPGRIRRKDTELIAVLRQCASPAITGDRPRPPVDALVIVELYIGKRPPPKHSGMWFIRPRITGRVLSVRTGQHLGGFEVGDKEVPAGLRHCDDRCLESAAGRQSRLLAEELGEALAAKLQALNTVGPDGCAGRSQNYFITFAGFEREQMTKAEDLMRKFGCYRDHRPLKVDAGRIQYYYASHAGEGSLMTNLRMLMDDLAPKGTVTKTAAGEYLVTRVGTR